MVYADLHVHTDCSDGQMTLPEVPRAARRAGVRAVAVTDHDRIHPDLSAPVVEFPRDGDPGAGTARDDDPGAGTTHDDDPSGGNADRSESDDPASPVTVVRGIELRVEAGDQRVDLLGYGLERTDDLEATVDRIQTDRKERGRAIIECVEDRLGVDLGLEPREGLGRPHVARAVADHPGTGVDYEAAFDELIGNDRPCFVAREIPSFEEGRRVLAAACPVVGLAHPMRYPDPEAALELTAELDAVELDYPYGREVDLSPVRSAIEDHDLLATGGSDAHDDRLGLAGLDRGAFDNFESKLR